MANKKYTLCFKAKNKFGYYHEIKLIKADLKTIDLYTSNYVNYVDLFNNLPSSVKSFIKEELSYNLNLNDNKALEECFYIMEFSDFKLLFKDDLDIVYITALEIAKLICKEKLSYKSLGRVIINMNPTKKEKETYEFFKYLYEKHVKKKELLKMIDTYDIKKNYNKLDNDNTLIASIATDKDNILVLCKKISQTDEARRALAIMYKKLFSSNYDKSLIDLSEIEKRKKEKYNDENIIREINKNIGIFKGEYLREYTIV